MNKLGRATDQRMAILRNQASYLLWNGKIETTVTRAKEVQSYAEKLITLAINTHEDIVKVPFTKVDAKGKETKLEKINDGTKKLAARRKLMAKLYDIPQNRLPEEKDEDYAKRTKNVQHPLVEKIFDEIAPKYAKRAEEKGQRGGYTRIVKIGMRRGDAAEMAVLELI